ncbi:hypothetical protein [Kitasatospora sp. NBC_01266]|uniref:hypothetical protein n=1 Tax=Kitasatospora sp. NBC_01266 TaxID=2903572 RepID=UPI002E319852|nr:hypothetical protein [Kitasatospora sp. NBC_01266]
MPRSRPVSAELPGVWRRTFAREADGSTDRVTDTTWIQGPSLFADLRRPPGLAELVGGGSRLNDLDRPQLLALCEQKAFAGTLDEQGDAFGWTRLIDLHPPAPLPDAGTLRWADGAAVGVADGTAARVLVEEGLHEDYLEHWELVEAPGGSPAAAVLLQDPADGRAGLLVRAGSWFGYARDRREPLPDPLAPLREQVLGCAERAAAVALLDCEVSIGRVREGRWEILRSTLPHRVGARLRPEPSRAGETLLIHDTDPQGRPRPRSWQLTYSEGPFSLC